MIRVRGVKPTSSSWKWWEARDVEWMAIHGFALEANDRTDSGLLLHCFTVRGHNNLSSDSCLALASAMRAFKDFGGTLGRVRRVGEDIECPMDLEARRLRNRQLDSAYEAVVSQAKLESFIEFLESCGGLYVLG